MMNTTAVHYIVYTDKRWLILSEHDATLRVANGEVVHRVVVYTQILQPYLNGGANTFHTDYFVKPIKSMMRMLGGDLSVPYSARLGYFIRAPPTDTREKGCELTQLNVSSEFRGMSLARYLIGQVHQRAWEAGIPQVSAVLQGRCGERLIFLHHMGYRMVTNQIAPYSGYSDRWVHMMKILP